MVSKLKNGLNRTKRASKQATRIALLVLLTILLLAPGLMRDLVTAIPFLLRLLVVVILGASMGVFGYLRPLGNSLRRRLFHRETKKEAMPEAEKPAVSSQVEKDDEASREFWDFLRSTAKPTAEKMETAQPATETLAVSDAPSANSQPLSDQPEDQQTTSQSSS